MGYLSNIQVTGRHKILKREGSRLVIVHSGYGRSLPINQTRKRDFGTYALSKASVYCVREYTFCLCDGELKPGFTGTQVTLAENLRDGAEGTKREYACAGIRLSRERICVFCFVV